MGLELLALILCSINLGIYLYKFVSKPSNFTITFGLMCMAASVFVLDWNILCK